MSKRQIEQNSKVIFISGGGTSGHIHPALAIAKRINIDYPEYKIIFCGTANGLEAKVVPQAGFEFIAIDASPFPTRLSFKLFKALKKFWLGRRQCRELIKKYEPQAVIGTGGYVGAPLMAAAAAVNIPVIIHEQNAFPGRSNRFMATKATAVCLGFPVAAKFFKPTAKIYLTGNPIDEKFFRLGDREAKIRARESLNLPLDRKIILISGGSLGAKSLNEAALNWAKNQADLSNRSLQNEYRRQSESAQPAKHGQPVKPDQLAEEIKNETLVILAAGSRGYESTLEAAKKMNLGENLRIEPYLYNIHLYMAAADLIISRAGAITCAEIAALSKASVLIPYPYAAGDHQTYNAKVLVEAGAALLFKDNEWNGDELGKIIASLNSDAETWQQRSSAAGSLKNKEAVSKIVSVIKEAIQENKR